MGNMRQASKGSWNSDDTREDINAGSFQRIADATEKMATGVGFIIEERERLKSWHEFERDRADDLEQRLDKERRSRAGYQGTVKRLKRAVPPKNRLKVVHGDEIRVWNNEKTKEPGRIHTFIGYHVTPGEIESWICLDAGGFVKIWRYAELPE